MNEAAIREEWRSRGFGFGLWTDSPGQVWADFVHETDEVVMLVEGEIELSFLGKVVRPRIGEEVLIPAGASHTVKNIGKTANRWYYGYKRVGV